MINFGFQSIDRYGQYKKLDFGDVNAADSHGNSHGSIQLHK